MIAHEHIQKIRIKEFTFTVIIAIIISSLLYLNNFLFNDPFVYIIALSLIVLGMNLTVYLIKKTGITTLFLLLTAFFTSFIADVGIMSWKKLIVFLVAGIIFEIIYLILKYPLHNLTLDVIVGTTIATASIPFTTAIFLSANLVSSFPLILINWIVLALVVGLISSIVTALIWHELEHTKTVIKIEASLKRLE